MNKSHNLIFLYIVFGALSIFAAFILFPHSAHAAAGTMTMTIVNSDPCAPSGGFCDPTNAEEGNDTVTYEFRLTGTNDNISATFRLQASAGATASTNEAA